MATLTRTGGGMWSQPTYYFSHFIHLALYISSSSLITCHTVTRTSQLYVQHKQKQTFKYHIIEARLK